MLQPMLSDFGERLAGGKTHLSAPLQNSLATHREALPQLPLPAAIHAGEATSSAPSDHP